MDIVYYVKQSDDNEELRYSLRTLKNIPHDNVFMVGYVPEWVTGVKHIPVDQYKGKYENTKNFMRIVAENKDVSDDYILMNDDFFIMKPISEIPRYRRDTVSSLLKIYEKDGLANKSYAKGMRETLRYMEELGYNNPFSYELHIPVVYNKDKAIKMLDRFDSDSPKVSILHKRTLYGNMYNTGGEYIKDVKVRCMKDEFNEDSTFLSTSDDIWEQHEVGRFIRSKFVEKCKYEK